MRENINLSFETPKIKKDTKFKDVSSFQMRFAFILKKMSD